MGKDISAHPLLDALRRPRHEPPAGERQQAPEENRDHHRGDKEKETPSGLDRHRHPGGEPGGQSLAEEDVVYRQLRRCCRSELEEGRRRAEHHPADHHHPVATEDPGQLEEQLRDRPLPLTLGPAGLLDRIAAATAIGLVLQAASLAPTDGGGILHPAVQRSDAPCQRPVTARP